MKKRAEPEKLILKRSVPVESFGGEEHYPLPAGEYRPTVWDVGGGGCGFNEWWLVTVDCHQFALGLPAQEWKFLAGKGFLTIQKKEGVCAEMVV